MIIVDLMTSFGEVQIEKHPTSVGFGVERLNGEVIVDAGKFSCAMSWPERRSRMWNRPRLHPAVFVTILGLAFWGGLATDEVAAKEWVLQLSKRIYAPDQHPQ